jgi:tRNA A37 threonylcarbamoyladenosine modification protein TsaB
VIDARRGEVFAGIYRLDPDGAAVTPLVDDRVVSPTELDAAIAAAAAGAPAVVFGDGLARVPGLTFARPLDGARATPSAASIARLAAAGRAVDGLRSGPVYLRQAEAEIKFPPGSPVPGTFSKK